MTSSSPLPAQGASAPSARGRLYLVPAPLDHGCSTQASLTQLLPPETLATAARLTHWISENARSTRAYLKRVDAAAGLVQPLQAQQIAELPRMAHKKGDHTGAAGAGYDARPLLAAALEGHDIGLVSEAGMPAVADPGSAVVRAAHDLGLEVHPLVGPVSLLLALAASGLNGQSFAFVGYLPHEARAREQRLRELETLALQTGQTQLFIETPYRNAMLMQSLLRVLQPATRLAVSAGLTLPDSRTSSRNVAAWRRIPWELDNDTPAVFAIGR